MPSRRLSVVVTIVLVFALAVVAIAPAFAAPAARALPMHAQLLGSTPADGSTVETAAEVVLEFNEEVNPDFVAVRVAGPDGAEVDGAPVVDGRRVTQALRTDLAAGPHTVTYRVVSADGHPISGSVTFTTTAAPAATAPPSDTASATASAPVDSTASAGPAATPTPAATAPASTEADDGSTPWLVVALGVVLAVLALAAARRTFGRSGAEAATGPAPGEDVHAGGAGEGRAGAPRG